MPSRLAMSFQGLTYNYIEPVSGKTKNKKLAVTGVSSSESATGSVTIKGEGAKRFVAEME